jgi:hypothetical protein
VWVRAGPSTNSERSSVVTFCSTCTRALNFENVGQVLLKVGDLHLQKLVISLSLPPCLLRPRTRRRKHCRSRKKMRVRRTSYCLIQPNTPLTGPRRLMTPDPSSGKVLSNSVCVCVGGGGGGGAGVCLVCVCVCVCVCARARARVCVCIYVYTHIL